MSHLDLFQGKQSRPTAGFAQRSLSGVTLRLPNSPNPPITQELGHQTTATPNRSPHPLGEPEGTEKEDEG
jgi:hypothetical protein